MAQPAMTGRQQMMSMMMRMLGILEPRKPVRRMTIRQRPPSGNWKRMLASVDQPKVLTIKGPKPDTAPLTVYLVTYVSHRSLLNLFDCWKKGGEPLTLRPSSRRSTKP